MIIARRAKPGNSLQCFSYLLGAHWIPIRTYWYHSHVSTQYCDGLRGPMVIYDPLDPLKYLYDFDNGIHLN